MAPRVRSPGRSPQSRMPLWCGATKNSRCVLRIHLRGEHQVYLIRKAEVRMKKAARLRCCGKKMRRGFWVSGARIPTIQPTASGSKRKRVGEKTRERSPFGRVISISPISLGYFPI
jgi:hypothetical protein